MMQRDCQRRRSVGIMEPNHTPADFRPRHRGLRVRQEAATLAGAVYEAVDNMIEGRRGSFSDQMRRAAVSIHANLAEGEGRDSPRDRLRFFTIAWASLRELNAHIELAVSVGALPERDATRLYAHCRHVGRMLHALRLALSDSVPTR